MKKNINTISMHREKFTETKTAVATSKLSGKTYFSYSYDYSCLQIKAPQALHNTPPLLGAPKVIL